MHIDASFLILVPVWLERFFSFALWISLGGVTTVYYLYKKGRLSGAFFERTGLRIFYSIIFLMIARALWLTTLQYFVWKANPVTAQLLRLGIEDRYRGVLMGTSAPVFFSSGGYFAYYSFTHFFLNPLIAIVVSLAWYGLLLALKRYKERFFEEGEFVLGGVCALVVGWPSIVIFIPLFFLLFSAFSVIRMVLFHHRFTTVAIPLLVATALTLAFSSVLIAGSALRVLRI